MKYPTSYAGYYEGYAFYNIDSDGSFSVRVRWTDFRGVACDTGYVSSSFSVSCSTGVSAGTATATFNPFAVKPSISGTGYSGSAGTAACNAYLN